MKSWNEYVGRNQSGCMDRRCANLPHVWLSHSSDNQRSDGCWRIGYRLAAQCRNQPR